MIGLTTGTVTETERGSYLQTRADKVGGRLACRWRDHLIAIGAFEKDESRRFRCRLILKVKEQILKEHKVAHLPLAVLRSALVQMATEAIVVTGLLRERQQLDLVHPHLASRMEGNQQDFNFAVLTRNGTMRKVARPLGRTREIRFRPFSNLMKPKLHF